MKRYLAARCQSFVNKVLNRYPDFTLEECQDFVWEKAVNNGTSLSRETLDALVEVFYDEAFDNIHSIENE